MKRGRKSGDQLTGGSGDVNPQEMVQELTQTGADTTTITRMALPIPRLPTKPGKNLVIELLWVQYFWMNKTYPGAGVISTMVANVTTNPVIPATFSAAVLDPKILSVWMLGSATFGAPATVDTFYPFYEEDLTDGAGHGILVASDSLYFNIFSLLTAQANHVGWRIGYRFKEVDLVEYIGIVQSQQ